MEIRRIRNDYTFRRDGGLYQIERGSIVSGMRGAAVRVEQRLDGSLAVRHGERYLPIGVCTAAEKPKPAATARPLVKVQRASRRGSDWDRNFDLKPKLWQAAQSSGYRRGDAIGETQCRGSGAKAKFALYREMLRTTGR